MLCILLRLPRKPCRLARGSKRQSAGSLRLGAADSIDGEWLAGLVHRYLSRYPDVRIHVRSGDGQSMMQMLLHNEVDLMMTVDHHLNDPMLVHAWDRSQRVHFVASLGHPITKVSSSGLKEILSYSLIRGDLSSACERNLEAAMAAEGVKPERWMEIESWNLMLGMLRYGDGIALAPGSCGTEAGGRRAAGQAGL